MADPSSPASSPARRARKALSLKGYALSLLAMREHSETELRRKLLRHLQTTARKAAELAARPLSASASTSVLDAPEAVADPGEARDSQEVAADAAQQVDDTIAWLRSNHHLSDARFVESRIHARERRYGNLRIRQELAQHGLALDAESAQALKESEFERAREVWRRKFGEPAADAAGRAKQARFLAQRGFSPELVSRLLRAVGRGRGEEDGSGEV